MSARSQDATVFQHFSSAVQVEVPAYIVESLRMTANSAFEECTRIIEREREIARTRTKIDKKYGQARRRKNTPYDQAGANMTVMLTSFGVRKPAYEATRILWHSGFSTLAKEMDVLDPRAPSEPGNEDVPALMRFGRFERQSVDEFEAMVESLPEDDERRQRFQKSVEVHRKVLKERRKKRVGGQ